MSYEFYIMSGIAVFVGCTWLYRKGKGAYMMVRKIRSAFKVALIPQHYYKIFFLST